MIVIEQNSIIKIFSWFTIFLLLPTLIASIYSMNLAAMLEFKSPYGFFYSLVLMLLSINFLRKRTNYKFLLIIYSFI
nr:CorA family divalent cation transporter [Rickettsia canadensis]